MRSRGEEFYNNFNVTRARVRARARFFLALHDNINNI
jgi:hypothetical protein